MTDSDHRRAPGAIVPGRPTAVDPLPQAVPAAHNGEAPFPDTLNRSRAARSSRAGSTPAGVSPVSNIHWVALGLIAIGTVGAVRGCMQRSRTRPRAMWRAAADSGDLTPPHGDKLLRRH
jgi:hypothetical protein